MNISLNQRRNSYKDFSDWIFLSSYIIPPYSRMLSTSKAQRVPDKPR